MAEQELVDALAACLDALRGGEDELAACLGRYTAFRTELEALLDVARMIPQLPPDIRPAPVFRERTRRLLVGHANGDPSSPSGPGWQPANLS